MVLMILLLFKCILQIVFKITIQKGIYFFIYWKDRKKRNPLGFSGVWHGISVANTGTLQKKTNSIWLHYSIISMHVNLTAGKALKIQSKRQ